LLAASAVALVAVVFVDALAVSNTAVRLAVLVCAVGIIAERSADGRTAIGAALLAWPLGNGFLEHREGVLSWQTATDFPLALGLLFAVAVGMCLAQARLARRAWQQRYSAPRFEVPEQRSGGRPVGRGRLALHVPHVSLRLVHR
jgi:hypothetical protein